MQKEIKRIHVLQCGLFLGAFQALLGLIVGLAYAFIMIAIGAAGATLGNPSGGGGTGGAEAAALFGGLGILAAVFIPIVYGLFGFIGGIIGAAIYNLVAKVAGGLKVDVADIGPALQ